MSYTRCDITVGEGMGPLYHIRLAMMGCFMFSLVNVV